MVSRPAARRFTIAFYHAPLTISPRTTHHNGDNIVPPRQLPTLNLDELTTHSLYDRPAKVGVSHLGRPLGPQATVAELVEAFPDQLAGQALRRWRNAICAARQADRAVVAALGGHVIKTGCGPYLIDWIRRDVLTAVCLNGAAAIHDVELALAGRTSEDVEGRLPDGSFGMTRETAQFFAEAADIAAMTGFGFGAALGALLRRERCLHPEVSLLRAAAEAGIPCTVHVAVGTDIVHMHPCASGARIGEATLRDFRLACAIVADLAGGVWMNLGSAVVLPEVFLKAVSIARNLGFELEGMTTVDLDMVRQYRARANVLERHCCPAIAVTGHHELILPLIHAAVVAGPSRTRSASASRAPIQCASADDSGLDLGAAGTDLAGSLDA